MTKPDIPEGDNDTKEFVIPPDIAMPKDNPLNTIDATVEGQTFDVNALMGGIVTRDDVGEKVDTFPVLSSERGQQKFEDAGDAIVFTGLPSAVHFRDGTEGALQEKKQKCEKYLTQNPEGGSVRFARCVIMLIDELMQNRVLQKDAGLAVMQDRYAERYTEGYPLTDVQYFMAFKELCKSKYGDIVKENRDEQK